MISSISSLEKVKVVNPDPNIFLWIAASIAAVNPYCIKTLFTNDFSTFPIKGNPVFNNGPKSLPKNPPDCPVLCNWDFDNFMKDYFRLLKITSVPFLITNFSLLICELDNFTFNPLYWVILH